MWMMVDDSASDLTAGGWTFERSYDGTPPVLVQRSHPNPPNSIFLGGGFKDFFFHPYLGKMNPFWLIFFRRGWNHQPVLLDDMFFWLVMFDPDSKPAGGLMVDLSRNCGLHTIVTNGGWKGPYKWPKINRCHWGEITRISGVISPYL